MPSQKAQKNSADPDQTASSEAVGLGSVLLAILAGIICIPALITNILFENRKGKLLEIFGRLS